MPEADANLLYLRDLADVEPPRDRYAYYEEGDIYCLVPRPQWTGLEDEIWTPRSQEHDPQLEKVKALMKRNASSASGMEVAPQSVSGVPTSPTAITRRPSREDAACVYPRVRVLLAVAAATAAASFSGVESGARVPTLAFSVSRL